MRVQAEIESAQALRLPDGITVRRCAAHAVIGMSGAMPHGKLCRVPVRTRCGGGFPVRRLGIVVDPFIGSSGTSRQGLPDGNALFSFRPKFPSWPGFVL